MTAGTFTDRPAVTVSSPRAACRPAARSVTDTWFEFSTGDDICHRNTVRGSDVAEGPRDARRYCRFPP